MSKDDSIKIDVDPIKVSIGKDDDVKQIKESQEKLNGEIQKNKAEITNIKNQIEPDDIIKSPPFTIKSLLELAWGMSLPTSTVEYRRDLGKVLNEKIHQVFQRYHKEYPTADNKINRTDLDERNERFVNNILFSLTRTIHNISNIREVHSKYVTELLEDKDRIRKRFQDQGTLTSFSSDGIIAKISSFVGGGSLVTLLDSSIFKFSKNTFDEKITRIEKLLALSNSTEFKESIHPEVVQTITKEFDVLTESALANPSYDIALFVASGIITILLVTYALKRRNKTKFQNTRIKINKEIELYLHDSFRPDVKNSLVSFYKDIKRLMIYNYFKSEEEYKKYFKNEFNTRIDNRNDNNDKQKEEKHTKCAENPEIKHNYNENEIVEDFICKDILNDEMFHYQFKKSLFHNKLNNEGNQN